MAGGGVRKGRREARGGNAHCETMIRVIRMTATGAGLVCPQDRCPRGTILQLSAPSVCAVIAIEAWWPHSSQRGGSTDDAGLARSGSPPGGQRGRGVRLDGPALATGRQLAPESSRVASLPKPAPH